MQRVFVTGGNSGIGFELCKQLIKKHGCQVFMGVRNTDKGSAAIEQIIKDNAQAESKIEMIKVDVTDQSSVIDAAAEVRDRLGTKKLYGLINNAGCIPKPDGATVE